MSVTARVGKMVYLLCQGEEMTAADAAKVLGITSSGARRTLEALSSAHGLPLTWDARLNDDGRAVMTWYIMDRFGRPIKKARGATGVNG